MNGGCKARSKWVQPVASKTTLEFAGDVLRRGPGPRSASSLCDEPRHSGQGGPKAMSINRSVATAALALGVVAMNAVSFASVASAADPRHRRPVAAARVVAPAVRHAAPVVRHHAPAPRHHGGRGVGAGVALGVGALIVGSILASKHARAERRVVVVDRDEEAFQRCADDFRSFDWDTGTIVNRYGDRVACPYLD